MSNRVKLTLVTVASAVTVFFAVGPITGYGFWF